MLPYNSLLMNTFLWMPNFWEIYAVQTPFTESSWFSLNQLDMPFQAHFLLEAVRGGVSFLPATGIPKLHHLWEATGRLGNKTVLPVQLPISLKCNLKGLLRNFSNSGGGRSAIWPPIKTTEGSSLWKTEGTFFLWRAFLDAVCWHSADLSPEVQTSLCYWLLQYTSCGSHRPYLRMGKVKESQWKTKQSPT